MHVSSFNVLCSNLIIFVLSVATASSDCTICVVSRSDDEGHDVTERLLLHKDYVKRVLSRSDSIISAGLDGLLAVQSLEAGKTGYIVKYGVQKKHSFYALDANRFGTIICVAGADQHVRVYDTRTPPQRQSKPGPFAKLQGHTDTVKALQMTEDKLIVSAGADNVVKVWDLRMQAAERTFEMHSDSVWGLTLSGDSSSVFSSGRDGDVFRLNYRTGEAVRVLHDTEPISSVCTLPDGRMVSSSAVGTVKLWDLAGASADSVVDWVDSVSESAVTVSESPLPEELLSLKQKGLASPVSAAPVFTLKRDPAINKCQILPNRFQLLSLDSTSRVQLWSILRGRPVEDFGIGVDFDKKFQELSEQISVPSWCSVDCKIGSISITLDAGTCDDAWIYEDELGEQNSKVVNLGVEMLRYLFHRVMDEQTPPTPLVASTMSGADSAIVVSPKATFVDMPDGIWIAVTRDGACRDLASHEAWESLQGVPLWVLELATGKKKSAPKKLALKIVPGPRVGLSSDRVPLSGASHTRMSKVIGYFATDVCKFDLEPAPIDNRTKFDEDRMSMFSVQCKGKVLRDGLLSQTNPDPDAPLCRTCRQRRRLPL